MVPFMEKYKDVPWLVYTEGEPSEEAKAFIPGMLEERAKYPFESDLKAAYLDDTVPADVSCDVHQTKRKQKLAIFSSDAVSKEEERLLFYIHGGGYIRGNGPYNHCNAMVHLRAFGIPTACCEYSMAPEYREGVALDDVEAAWDYLVEDLGYAPSKIVVTGDSAGGQLGLSLMLRLKKAGRELPMGAAFYSPSADLHMDSDSHAYNTGRDIIFPNDVKSFMDAYVDEERLDHPDASPVFGDFSGGFPKVYFCAEDTEVMCSDTLECARHMAEQGAPVLCHIYHGLWHAWPTLHPVPPLPKEVYDVFDEIKTFLGLSLKK